MIFIDLFLSVLSINHLVAYVFVLELLITKQVNHDNLGCLFPQELLSGWLKIVCPRR